MSTFAIFTNNKLDTKTGFNKKFLFYWNEVLQKYT